MDLDTSRQAATSNDEYSLTIDDALLRYEHAGHPRTPRSIQRYCSQGHLDCLRQQTPFGEKYLITPASIARHLAQIAELAQATRRDMSRPDAAQFVHAFSSDNSRHEVTGNDNQKLVAADPSPNNSENQPKADASISHDEPRLVATRPDMSDKYIGRLEGEVAFLRDEISTKNAQIKELTERSRETNLLVGGLQRMLAPLLGQPDPYPQSKDNQTA